MIGFSAEELADLQKRLKAAYDALNNFCKNVIDALQKCVGEEEQEECPYPESLIYQIYVVQRYIAPSLHNNRHWHIRDPPGVIHNSIFSNFTIYRYLSAKNLIQLQSLKNRPNKGLPIFYKSTTTPIHI